MTDNELFLLILMLVMGLPWLIWRLLGDADQAPLAVVQIFVGVLLGPAVFGWITPTDAIQLLAEIGIFFLMFHAGVETQPSEFFDALKRSMGVAIVGAAVPFAVSFGVASWFGFGGRLR